MTCFVRNSGNPDKPFEVLQFIGNRDVPHGLYETLDEAKAVASYLNGGLHPELAGALLLLAHQANQLLPLLFRDELIDPRAMNPRGAQCVHGRYPDEDCPACADPDARPPGAAPIV